MTKVEQFHQHVRDAAASLERAIDMLDDLDPGDTANILAHREYLLGRLELIADATEAFLPETVNAVAHSALDVALRKVLE